MSGPDDERDLATDQEELLAVIRECLTEATKTEFRRPASGHFGLGARPGHAYDHWTVRLGQGDGQNVLLQLNGKHAAQLVEALSGILSRAGWELGDEA